MAYRPSRTGETGAFSLLRTTNNPLTRDLLVVSGVYLPKRFLRRQADPDGLSAIRDRRDGSIQPVTYNKKSPTRGFFVVSGADETRTRDLLRDRQAL